MVTFRFYKRVIAMKLYILGNTNDDKGTQLEILTKEMLEKQGYSNIAGNVIVSGGSEFDAVASYKMPLATNYIEYQVICECKAHSNPINITDWMKFIGKVYVEKLKNDHTTGLMIALSGANGNVIGSYNEIKDRGLVNLMVGDDIIEFLTKEYNLTSAQSIESYVKRFTDKSISIISLAYYDQAIYWIVGFIEGGFTVLKKNATQLNSKELEIIVELLNKNTEYTGYIDIEQENEARNRRINIEKVALSILMDASIPLSIDEVFAQYEDITTQKSNEKAAKDEIGNALRNNSFAIESEEKYYLKEFDIDSLIEFFKYIYSEILPVRLLGRKWFSEKINEELFTKVLDIQCKIKVSEKQRRECLFLIKHSPSALAYAIHPDEDLTRYRSPNGTTIAENVDKGHTQMFVQKLTDLFIKDFHNQALHELYFSDYGIFDVRIEQTLTVLNEGENVLSIVNNRNMSLGRLDKEFGNQIILISKLPED